MVHEASLVSEKRVQGDPCGPEGPPYSRGDMVKYSLHVVWKAGGMSKSEISRRHFARLAGTAALAGAPLAGQRARLTAQQVVERIQNNAGTPVRPQSSDGFKAGDPATLVKGIATTAMATMDVLTRASKENLNLVVTLQPTFFGQMDGQPGGRGQN